jgi:Mrp family chromosome partitioning ATPase
VIVVVEADRGRGGSLKLALHRLRQVGATVLGGVLTKFDPAKGGNAYATNYKYNYYTYQSADREAA